MHGAPATLHLEDLWIRNVTITTGLVDTYSMPTLIRLVQGGRLDMSPLITHRFPLDDLLQAYEVFGDAARSGALKVVMNRLESALGPRTAGLDHNRQKQRRRS